SVLRDIDSILRSQSESSVYEAFANSPPWWMTKSKCQTGTTLNTIADNLGANDLYSSNDQAYQAYATYLAQVILHFHTDLSPAINFATVDPFNEPNAFPWPSTAPSYQEGANFSVAAQDQVTAKLCAAIQSLGSGMNTLVSVPDGNSPDETNSDYSSNSSSSQAC